MPCFLRMHYMLGLSAPNPDTKDFSGKVLWNLKSFAKIKYIYKLNFRALTATLDIIAGCSVHGKNHARSGRQ